MPQGSGHFDQLKPDYAQEVPSSSDKSMESIKRFLYMLKLSLNGQKMLLIDTVTGAICAVSSEFTTEFGWVQSDFENMDFEEMIHADDRSMVAIHEENNLAAPYIARCIKKSGDSEFYVVQGLSVKCVGHTWRMAAFDNLT